MPTTMVLAGLAVADDDAESGSADAVAEPPGAVVAVVVVVAFGFVCDTSPSEVLMK